MPGNGWKKWGWNTPGWIPMALIWQTNMLQRRGESHELSLFLNYIPVLSQGLSQGASIGIMLLSVCGLMFSIFTYTSDTHLILFIAFTPLSSFRRHLQKCMISMKKQKCGLTLRYVCGPNDESQYLMLDPIRPHWTSVYKHWTTLVWCGPQIGPPS